MLRLLIMLALTGGWLLAQPAPKTAAKPAAPAAAKPKPAPLPKPEQMVDDALTFRVLALDVARDLLALGDGRAQRIEKAHARMKAIAARYSFPLLESVKTVFLAIDNTGGVADRTPRGFIYLPGVWTPLMTGEKTGRLPFVLCRNGTVTLHYDTTTVTCEEGCECALGSQVFTYAGGRWSAIPGRSAPPAPVVTYSPERTRELFRTAGEATAEAISQLAAQGADVDYREDDHGYSPLYVAVYKNNLPAVRALIAAGAKADRATNQGQTPLDVAAVKCRREAYGLLIAAGASTTVADGDGETPLLYASRGDCLDVVSDLLKRGADPAAATKRGVTALWNAASAPNHAMVEALLAAKAPVNAANSQKQTPLFAAIHKGGVAMVRALIAAGADVKTPDAQSLYPLHLAAARGDREIVRALLDAGASVDVVDNEGRRPYDWARQRRNSTILDLLSSKPL